MSSYSIRENPFTYGLARVSQKDADLKFASKWSINSQLDEDGLPPFTSEEAFSSMNKMEQTVFYSGRVIRFGVSTVGTVADFALQFFQCLFATPVALLIKGESLLRNCKPGQTYSIHTAVLVAIPSFLRNATDKQFYYLIDDVEKVANYTGFKKIESFASDLKHKNFASNYCNFLYFKLFLQKPIKA